MTVHAAEVRRRPDHWIRWGWHCPPCGAGEWVGGKEAAEAAADVHNEPPAELAKVLEFVRDNMHCQCWDSDVCEYADEPCDKCKLLRLAGGGAA